MKTRVTKVFTFDSAHSLTDYDGPCKNLHGHTYRLEVTLEEPSDRTFQREMPMLVDFSRLSEWVKHSLVKEWDHQYLNKVLAAQNPTAEMMAMMALNRLRHWDKRIVKVRIWETPTSWAEVEYEGD